MTLEKGKEKQPTFVSSQTLESDWNHSAIYRFKSHPKRNWFNHRAYVLTPDLIKHGPATFIPVSRVRCRSAIIEKKVQFDYGEDVVPVAILCGSNYSV